MDKGSASRSLRGSCGNKRRTSFSQKWELGKLQKDFNHYWLHGMALHLKMQSAVCIICKLTKSCNTNCCSFTIHIEYECSVKITLGTLHFRRLHILFRKYGSSGGSKDWLSTGRCFSVFEYGEEREKTQFVKMENSEWDLKRFIGHILDMTV